MTKIHPLIFCCFLLVSGSVAYSQEDPVATKERVKDPNQEARDGYRKFPVLYDEKADMIYSYEARARSYEDIMNNAPINPASDPLSMSNIELLIDTNDYNGLATLLTENPGAINTIQKDGITPLHHAVSRKSKAMTDIILLSGFDVNKINENGEPFLLNLLKGESVSGEILQLLLSKVADIDAKDKDGNTLSTIAIQSNSPSLLEIVIGKGANPNYKHPSKGSLLQIAIQNVDYRIVQILLEKGANPNIKIEMSNTYNPNTQTVGLIDSTMNPLALAMLENNRSLFKLLLVYVLKTEDPERRDSLNMALRYATKIGDEDYKQDLRSAIKNIQS